MSHRCIERVAIRDSCQIKSRSTVVPIRPLETPWIITLIAATCRRRGGEGEERRGEEEGNCISSQKQLSPAIDVHEEHEEQKTPLVCDSMNDDGGRQSR